MPPSSALHADTHSAHVLSCCTPLLPTPAHPQRKAAEQQLALLAAAKGLPNMTTQSIYEEKAAKLTQRLRNNFCFELRYVEVQGHLPVI
jgi:hypothetical protein